MMESVLTPLGPVSVGSVLSWSHRHEPADLKVFADISGRDSVDGNFLPDVLVIAPLTKLGGDLNYIARRMAWQVHRRVTVQERLEARLEVTGLEDAEGFFKIRFSARILGDGGEVIADGDSKGIILKSGRTTFREGLTTMPSTEIAAGTVFRSTRQITESDIRKCADLTGDRGAHHIAGPGGRPIAQGLLTTATAPLVRGDHGYRYTSISVTFLAPVYVDDTITSEVVVSDLAPAADGSAAARISLVIRNQDGAEVVKGEGTGVLERRS